MKLSSTANMHPGLVLNKELVKAKGLSVGSVAKMMDVSRMTMSKILNGKGAITPNIALRLEYVFAQDPMVWLKLQLDYDFEQARANFQPNARMHPYRY